MSACPRCLSLSGVTARTIRLAGASPFLTAPFTLAALISGSSRRVADLGLWTLDFGLNTGASG